MALCHCGCEHRVKFGLKYVHGHNRKGKKPSYEHVVKQHFSAHGRWPQSPMKILCGCGCEEYAEPGNEYIVGHNGRGRKHTDEFKLKVSKALKGRPKPKGFMCGEHARKVSETLKRRYRNGEISVWCEGKKMSDEHKMKLSKSHIGQKSMRKGIPLSEETKRKISASLKGRPSAWKGRRHSEKTKKKMSETQKQNPSCGMKGKRHTNETRRKISTACRNAKSHGMTGRQHTEETNRKLALAFSGDKSSTWKGGISCEPYCDAWADKEFKEDMKERDGYKCQNPECLGNSKRLCIHHIDYDKKNCHPNNLITLCTSCNSRANHDRNFWQELYQQAIIGG